MKLKGRDIGRITINKLIDITKIKVSKKDKVNSIESCDELIKEILDEYATRKHYVLLNELNEEVSLQRDRGNLYKEQLDEAVKKIKKLESDLAAADNSKALYKEIDALKEEVEILTKSNFELSMKNKELESYIDSSPGIDINNLFEENKIEKINRYLNTVFLVTFIIFSVVLTYKII